MTRPLPYLTPRRVWVDDGHVFVEGHDGATLVMTPEVALDFSRQIGQAGAESLINKVMGVSDPADDRDVATGSETPFPLAP